VLAAGRRDPAIDDRELARLDAQLGRRRREQYLTGLGAGEADGGAALLDRLTAGGKAFVWGAGGVGRHHVDAPVVHVEFVGGNLRQCARNALPEFDFAGEHRHGAIRIDAQPRRQEAIAVKAAGKMGRRRGALGQRR
jgi:hypothetical protein